MLFLRLLVLYQEERGRNRILQEALAPCVNVNLYLVLALIAADRGRLMLVDARILRVRVLALRALASSVSVGPRRHCSSSRRHLTLGQLRDPTPGLVLKVLVFVLLRHQG